MSPLLQLTTKIFHLYPIFSRSNLLHRNSDVLFSRIERKESLKKPGQHSLLLLLLLLSLPSCADNTEETWESSVLLYLSLHRVPTSLPKAEQWVDNMSKSLEDESTEVELEGRPSRLGLGAKVSRQCKVGPSNDPVERKLHAKLNAGKRKAAQRSEETTPSARGGCSDGDDEDEDLESRTNAFSKKRAAPLTSSLKAKKKLK